MKKSQKRGALINKWNLPIIGLIFAFLLSACTAVYPNTPITSRTDLQNSDMYGYILPDNVLTDREWTVEVGPFQLQCDLLNEDVWQPLHIDYYNKNGDFVFDTRMSDDDPLVPPTNPDGYFELDLDRNQNVRLEYRRTSNLEIYFEDINGLDVVISTTTLSVDELKTVIQSLEYVGEVDNPTIPWTEGC